MTGLAGWHRAAAFAALEAGLVPIPVKEDGTKSPAIKAWTPYRNAPPSIGEVSNWFAGDRAGIALVCGHGSGGLEMLEFEGRAIEEGVLGQFLDLTVEAGLEGVWERVSEGYVEESPSGGLHFFFTVPTARRSQVLARRPATDEELAENPKAKVKVLIETRGEGGYVVIAPSSGHVHETERSWRRLRGSRLDIVELSEEERDAIYEVARALDQVKPREVRNGPSRGKEREGERPGDAYNESGGVQEVTLGLLESDGWEVVSEQEFGYHIRRPGKTVGISASLGYFGPGVLYVFSTSTEFEPEKAYSPFAVLAELEFGGSFTAAAAALRDQGYGTSPETVETGETGALRVNSADRLTPKRAKLTLGGRLFVGSLNLLAGIGGKNKSTFTVEVAAQASRGELDGDLEGRPLRVLIASAEDADEEVIVPRLHAAGAELGNIVILDDVLTLPTGAQRLRETVADNQVDLVIVDPLVAFLESDVDSHRDADVRRALAALNELGEGTEVTILAVMHLNKDKASDAYSRLSGSVGFFNAARSVLVMTDDPRLADSGGARILWHEKCNVAPQAAPLECGLEPFELEGDGGVRIDTLKMHLGGEVEGVTFADALSADSDRVSKRFEVRRWVEDQVGDSEVLRNDLFASGQEYGYREDELRDAIRALDLYLGPGNFGADWVVRNKDHKR